MRLCCPTCGSVAVVKLDRKARCNNRYCKDLGIIKGITKFRQENAMPKSIGNTDYELCSEGSYRKTPNYE